MSEPAEGNRQTGASDFWADTAPPPSNTEINSAATARVSRRLVRVGWWICAGGLPLTLLGGRLIVAGGKSPTEFAQAVHTAGLLVILAGLLTALAGYRTPWLVNAIEAERRLYDNL